MFFLRNVSTLLDLHLECPLQILNNILVIFISFILYLSCNLYIYIQTTSGKRFFFHTYKNVTRDKVNNIRKKGKEIRVQGQEKSIKFDNVKPQVNKVCLKEFTQIYVSITE